MQLRPAATLDELRAQVLDCTACRLCQSRTQVVFGEGNPHSPLMIVGEGPGATEDEMGRPFVGKAGQLLNRILEAVGIRREAIYVTNIVKCRPPGNRTPEYDEMMTCIAILRAQFKLIRPKILVLLGAAPTRAILDKNARITQVRGTWWERKGVRIMPTYHPAYLLRNPTKKREAWEDWQKVRDAYVALLAEQGEPSGRNVG